MSLVFMTLPGNGARAAPCEANVKDIS
jgi:hypothetical protein